MTIVLQDRPVVCTACDGSGMIYYSGMGPVDNTDVWEEWEACPCGGFGYDDIEEVEVLL